MSGSVAIMITSKASMFTPGFGVGVNRRIDAFRVDTPSSSFTVTVTGCREPSAARREASWVAQPAPYTAVELQRKRCPKVGVDPECAVLRGAFSAIGLRVGYRIPVLEELPVDLEHVVRMLVDAVHRDTVDRHSGGHFLTPANALFTSPPTMRPRIIGFSC